MPSFIVRNHRDRKKLTLTAPAPSGHATVSITLTLTGKRVLELSDKVCSKYASALAEYVKAGALAPMTALPAVVAPNLVNEVHADELDEDPETDDDAEG